MPLTLPSCIQKAETSQVCLPLLLLDCLWKELLTFHLPRFWVHSVAKGRRQKQKGILCTFSHSLSLSLLLTATLRGQSARTQGRRRREQTDSLVSHLFLGRVITGGRRDGCVGYALNFAWAEEEKQQTSSSRLSTRSQARYHVSSICDAWSMARGAWQRIC